MKGYTHMTRAQEYAIGKAIEHVLKRVPSTEYFQYEDGWSDERIAREHQVKDAQVAKFRVAVFGKMIPGPGPDGGPLWAKFRELEARVADLERKGRVDNYVASNGISTTFRS